MLTLNDGVRTYGFVEKDINYISCSSNSLSIVKNDNSVTVIAYTSETTLTANITIFVERMYRQLATIGGLDGSGNGVIYWINAVNVANHNISASTITVSFQRGNTLSILCVNTTEATNHNNYLAKIYLSTHIWDYIADKTRLYVNPLLTENIPLGLYSDVQPAINNAVSGNVILVERAIYTSQHWILKNGVDIFVVEQGTEFYATSGTGHLITDNGVNVSCNIFGLGTYVNNSAGSGGSSDVFRMHGTSSNVFFEFHKLEQPLTGGFAVYQDRGIMRVKGYEIISNGACIDSDQTPTLVDVDTVRMDSNSIAIFPDNTSLFYMYFRNCYVEAQSEVAQLNSSSSNIYNFNLINARFHSTSGSAAVNNVDPQMLRFWRSVVDSVVSFIATDIYVYDTLFLKTALAGNITVLPVTSTTNVNGSLTFDTQISSDPLVLYGSSPLDEPEPIINGWGECRIDVGDRSYTFPVPSPKGLEEHLLFDEDETILEYRNKTVTRNKRIRKKFIIAYDELLDASYYWGLLDILQRYIAGDPITLYPYLMNRGYSFKVKWSNRDMILKYLRLHQINVGMQGTNLEFTEIKTGTSIGWQHTNDLIIKLPFAVK